MKLIGFRETDQPELTVLPFIIHCLFLRFAWLAVQHCTASAHGLVSSQKNARLFVPMILQKNLLARAHCVCVRTHFQTEEGEELVYQLNQQVKEQLDLVSTNSDTKKQGYLIDCFR